jgi:transposase
MGQKELLRGKVMELVKRGELTIKAASKELKISYRQGKGMYGAYMREGDKGLIQGNVGKPSNRRTSEGLREKALEAYREKYPDFGPTLAAEKLREVDGIGVGISTVRRWLLEEGLWQSRRQGRIYRSRRERRPCFGELVQFDGSLPRWFEGRGPSCCLITMIDDAANRRLALFFGEETTAGVMQVCSLWIRGCGIPRAL